MNLLIECKDRVWEGYLQLITNKEYLVVSCQLPVARLDGYAGSILKALFFSWTFMFSVMISALPGNGQLVTGN